MTEIEEFEDFVEIGLDELLKSDLKTLDERVTFQIFENNFPVCYISRVEENIEIRIEEHIYTKYWFHKYHATVFAEAMMKAIKRLRIEGVPFEQEELENEDDVHLFVRWSLIEPIEISPEDLKTNINTAFDSVFERANQMLEHSDSVLILGKDTGDGMDLLKRIQTHLDNLGYYTYIIKEQPDIVGESVMQKVLRYGLSSRFIIIENTEPTGHLYEFPHITKFAELTSIVLQQENKGATWMFEDLYHRLNNIKKFEYQKNDLEKQIDVGISWANEYLESFGNYQVENLPWLKKK